MFAYVAEKDQPNRLSINVVILILETLQLARQSLQIQHLTVTNLTSSLSKALPYDSLLRRQLKIKPIISQRFLKNSLKRLLILIRTQSIPKHSIRFMDE